MSWSWVWKVRGLESIRIFIWLALHDALPTNEMMTRRDLSMNNFCSRCNLEEEYIFKGTIDSRVKYGSLLVSPPYKVFPLLYVGLDSRVHHGTFFYSRS